MSAASFMVKWLQSEVFGFAGFVFGFMCCGLSVVFATSCSILSVCPQFNPLRIGFSLDYIGQLSCSLIGRKKAERWQSPVQRR